MLVFKTSWRRPQDISRRHLEDMPQRCLEDVLKTSGQDVLKTSWRFFENVVKAYDQDEYIRFDQDVLKMSLRRLLKAKTKDVFKTNLSRRMFAGKFKLFDVRWVRWPFLPRNLTAFYSTEYMADFLHRN